MDADQIARQERRELYNEQSRLLLARLMSEKGGMLTRGAKDSEIEARQIEFLRDMEVLDFKFLDVIREDWGFDPFDNSVSFGDDMEHRWENFFKNKRVKDEEGNPTILYEDKDGNYRLIPGKNPEIKDLDFIIKNYDKILIPDDEVVDQLPSITVMGIEGVSSDDYLNNTSTTEKEFYPNQIMIIILQLLDVLQKYKVLLKEECNSQLFKDLEEKFKKLF